MEAPNSKVAIAVFAYNRPEHLRTLLRSLANNAEVFSLPVYAFCDGPKNANEKELVESVRLVFEEYSAVLQIIPRFSESNQGLGASVIAGVTSVLESYESVIVLEDDLEVSPYFLSFMLRGLELYINSPNVASIHGYFYPTNRKLPATFFLPGADCWGWATWRHGWSAFEPDAKKLQDQLLQSGMSELLNYGGGKFFSSLLEEVAEGRSDSWAIRWHASNVLAGRFTLYPGKSLVVNNGNDGSGTNSAATDRFCVSLASTPVKVRRKRIKPSRRATIAVREIWDISDRRSFRDLIYILAGKQMPLRAVRDLARRAKKWFLKGKTLPAGGDIAWFRPSGAGWDETKSRTKGYDDPEVLAKVRLATANVLEGKSNFERDGVNFEQLEIRWPLVAEVLYQRASRSEVGVIDVGGGLASTWLQLRPFLNSIEGVTWGVLEQESYVMAGRELFQHGPLFFDDIDEALLVLDPAVAYFGASLQYFQNPWSVLKKIMTTRVDSLVIDRAPTLPNDSSLTVQDFPAPNSYPAWVLSESRIRRFLLKHFEVCIDFQPLETPKRLSTGEQVSFLSIAAHTRKKA